MRILQKKAFSVVSGGITPIEYIQRAVKSAVTPALANSQNATLNELQKTDHGQSSVAPVVEAVLSTPTTSLSANSMSVSICPRGTRYDFNIMTGIISCH